MQKDFVKQVNNPKAEVKLSPIPRALKDKVASLVDDRFDQAYALPEKLEREQALSQLFDDVTADMSVFEECNTDGPYFHNDSTFPGDRP